MLVKTAWFKPRIIKVIKSELVLYKDFTKPIEKNEVSLLDNARGTSNAKLI